MRHPRPSVVVVLLVVCAAAWLTERKTATQAPAASYSVTDVGTLGGPTSVARGVYGGGWLIAGTSTRTDGTAHAFVREFLRPPRDLGTLGGATSEVRGSSRFGAAVVGRAQVATGRHHAFLWANGRMLDLGTLGGSESVAHAVNDAEIVVGASHVAGDGATRAFVYQGGAMAPLGATLGGANSSALGINNAGRVVGHASLPAGGVTHAFLFANGVTTDLGSPGGDSAAVAINEIDQVAGYWTSTDRTSSRAFLYSAGYFQTLPALGGPFTYANAIDGSGVVVGESDNASGVRRAVMWRNGQITDLNSLIPPGSGWLLQSATAIDNYGHIVGYGVYGGQQRAFMLVPPADMALSLLAHQNYLDTNIPNPHEAGRTLDLGVTVQNLSPSFITGIVITDTITGPIEYVSWDTAAADCTQAGQTLTCRLTRYLQPGGIDVDLMIRARSTGPGAITHSATARADQLDPDPANNSGTESNRAVSLAALTLSPTTVVGGGVSLGRTTLTSPAPRGGATVRLTSSNPTIASVPSPFEVQGGAGDDGMWREFYVRTTAVSVPTTVQIGATYGLVTLTQSLTILPSGSLPPGGTARPVPGTIQAEDFDLGGSGVAYLDTTSGNRGGAYRSTDVDIENTADAGGGYNVGWTRAGEWLNYTVHVATAGSHTFSARVASAAAGGTFHAEFGGANKTGPLAVPDTGGWQSWTTITKTVTLAAGTQVMRIVFDTNGASGGVGNFNWMRLDATSTSQPFGGTPRTLPGTVQAEDFDEGGSGVGYSDTTSGNRGGQYRSTDVDIEATTDAGGGFNVGWTRPGEWLNFTVNVAAPGTYVFSARVAALGPGGTFHAEFGGVDRTGALAVPDTGGWQSWTTITKTVTLPAGVQVMRIVFDSPGTSGGIGNVNWVRLDATASSQPYGGTPRTLPGMVQAEDFDTGGNGVGYLDTTSGNTGGQYRATDVDIEVTGDTGGGYNVGWMVPGEWLKYTVRVTAAGTYTLHARVAANGPGGTFHVEFDGVDKTGTMVVPNTGGWQAWTTITRTVSLTAGTQVMRVVLDAPGSTGIFGNLNHLSITSGPVQ